MKSNATNSTRQREYVRKLVFAGLFVGVAAVLKLFEFNFSQDLRFNLVEIPWILSGILLGPAWGFAVGCVSDIVNFFVRTTGAFNPGFTFSAGLTGLIPGLVFMIARKQKSKSVFPALTVCAFAIAFAGVFFAVIRAGFLRIEGGSVMLRDSPVSWGFVAALFGVFVASSLTLVIYYRRFESPDLAIKPHLVLFAVASAELFCSLLLNSGLLYFMYGAGTVATFPIRLFKVVVAIPVFTTVTLVILNMIAKRKLIRF
jgi:ECF transporter S component (folate family)